MECDCRGLYLVTADVDIEPFTESLPISGDLKLDMRGHMHKASQRARSAPAKCFQAARAAARVHHVCKAVPEPTPYHIRVANEADAPSLAALDAICSRDGSAGWSDQTFRDDLSGHLTKALVVQAENGGIVGFGSMRVVAGEAELQNMAVAPEHRGMGVAKQLLLALLQASGCLDAEGAAGGAPCHLEVRVNNTPAVALYRSLGFQEVGQRKKFYSDGADALLMTRPPGPTPSR